MRYEKLSEEAFDGLQNRFKETILLKVIMWGMRIFIKQVVVLILEREVDSILLIHEANFKIHPASVYYPKQPRLTIFIPFNIRESLDTGGGLLSHSWQRCSSSYDGSINYCIKTRCHKGWGGVEDNTFLKACVKSEGYKRTQRDYKRS